MKILFDQGTPVPLRQFLPNHIVETAYEKGWSNLKNGDLLTLAEAEGLMLLSQQIRTFVTSKICQAVKSVW